MGSNISQKIKEEVFKAETPQEKARKEIKKFVSKMYAQSHKGMSIKIKEHKHPTLYSYIITNWEVIRSEYRKLFDSSKSGFVFSGDLPVHRLNKKDWEIITNELKNGFKDTHQITVYVNATNLGMFKLKRTN